VYTRGVPYDSQLWRRGSETSRTCRATVQPRQTVEARAYRPFRNNSIVHSGVQMLHLRPLRLCGVFLRILRRRMDGPRLAAMSKQSGVSTGLLPLHS
jgi:hypothetical protein